MPRVQPSVLNIATTTLIAGMPAVIGLMAWSEGGQKLMRAFGARMLWELAGLVAVGIAILLYTTLQIVPGEGANITVISVAAICAVLLVTIVTQRVQVESPKWRFALSAGLAIVGVQAGVFAGIGVYLLVW